MKRFFFLFSVTITLVSLPASSKETVRTDKETVHTESVTTVDLDVFPKDMKAKPPEAAQNVEGSSGTFSWSIPIAVPSYYGIEPGLALSYNSAAGNGVAGVGWSLGYSTIERRGGRTEQEWNGSSFAFNPSLPRYDDSDAYFFNGQELVQCSRQVDPSKSGDAQFRYSPSCRNVFSAIGSSALSDYYSTRIESFQRIERLALSNAWKVWRKDGSVATYEPVCYWSTPTPGVVGNVSRWGLKTVTNANGAMVTYDGDCEKGLKKVTYHGGKVVVDTNWEPRTDKTFFNDGIGIREQNERLQSIAVSVQGSEVRRYNLTYAQSSSSKRSLLQTVTERAGALSQPPVRIAWHDVGISSDGSSALFEVPDLQDNSTNAWVGKYTQAATGDFNGDGIQDVFLKDSEGSTGAYVAIGLKNGGFNLINITNLQVASGGTMAGRWWSGKWDGVESRAAAHPKILTGDFNGDGKTDILIQPLRCHGSVASVGHCRAKWDGRTPPSGNPDNRAWYLEAGGDYIFKPAVDVGNATSWLPGGADGWDAFYKEMVTGDFNGDRCTDILVRGIDRSNRGLPGGNEGKATFVGFLMAHCPAGNSTRFDYASAENIIGSQAYAGAYDPRWDVFSHDMIPVDFNGDGISDILLKGELSWSGLNTTAYLIHSRLPTTAENYPFKSRQLSSTTGHNAIPGDYNGDGAVDLLFQSDGGSGGNFIWMNRGSIAGSTEFTSYPANLGTAGSLDNVSLVPGDFNGDGKTDLVLQDIGSAATGDMLKVALSNGSGLFSAPVPLPMPTQGTAGSFSTGNRRVLSSDLTGWGRTDLIARPVFDASSGGAQYDTYEFRSRQVSSDLISNITTSAGGTYEVTYFPYSAGDFPVTQVVTSLSVSDGISGANTTHYRYRDGKYDRDHRKSLGFGWVQITLPKTAGESDYPIIETNYLQDYDTASLPYVVNHFTGTDPENPESFKLLRKTAQMYCRAHSQMTSVSCPSLSAALSALNKGGKSPMVGTGPGGGGGSAVGLAFWYSVLPSYSIEHYYPAGASIYSEPASRTAKQTLYDLSGASMPLPAQIYGNSTAVVDYGLYDSSGYSADDRRTLTSYDIHDDAATYRVGQPSSQAVISGGDILSEARYGYDANGNLTSQKTKVKDPIAGTVSDYTKTFAYDTYGNPTQETNEIGAAVKYGYETTFNYYRNKTTVNPGPSSPADQTTRVTQWNYACGAPEKTADPNGQVTTVTYDDLCRVTRKQLPTAGTEAALYERTEYHLNGVPGNQYVQTSKPQAVAGNTAAETWVKTYMDGLGRNIVTQSGSTAGGPVVWTKTVYNERGLVSAKSKPTIGASDPSKWIRIWYDILNRPVQEQYGWSGGPSVFADYELQEQSNNPVGGSDSTSYAFQKVTYTDEEGHRFSDLYDTQGKIVQHSDFIGTSPVSSTTVYNPLGQPVKTIDPSGNTIRTVFDSRGLLRRGTDPDRGTTTFEYDAAGRLVKTTDGKNQRVLFTYDLLNRKLQKQLVRSDGTTESTVSWVYDQPRTGSFNVGRLTMMQDGPGYEQYSYDHLGRPRQTIRSVASNLYVYSQTYDANGQLSGKYYPGNLSYTVGYDPFGRLASVSGAVSSIEYNAAGQPTVQTNTNGTVTRYTYDEGRGWLKKIETKKGSTFIQSLDYSNRNQEGMLIQNIDSVANRTWTYTYDDLHRLIQATNSLDASATEQYEYDDLGNLKRKKVGTGIGTYSYPSGAVRPHAVSSVSASCPPKTRCQMSTGAYSYDENGNMTNHAGDTIDWTVENLPKKITKSGQQTLFFYDGNGNRIMKTAPDSGTTVYLDGGTVEITP